MSLIRPFLTAVDTAVRRQEMSAVGLAGAGSTKSYALGGLSAAISAAMRAASSVPGSRAGAADAGAGVSSRAASCACKPAICARRASVSSTVIARRRPHPAPHFRPSARLSRPRVLRSQPPLQAGRPR